MISMPVTHKTGWDAWSPQQAEDARKRHARRTRRLTKKKEKIEKKSETSAYPSTTQKNALIQAALKRARIQREQKPS
jgi:electron transport complex protein RnfB